MLKFRAICIVLIVVNLAVGQEAEPPSGFWSPAQAKAILDKTLMISVEPELAQLSAAEWAALQKLLEVGTILHDLYLLQRHEEAHQAEALIAEYEETAGTEAADDLRKLFWISKGPIVTTLTNERVPFVPVAKERPGKNVYPASASKDELDALMAKDPLLRNELLAVRHVVRENTAANRERDRELLQLYPVLSTLHAGFARHLDELEDHAAAYYATPYAIAYAKQLLTVFSLLNDAAECLVEEDPEFAGYLTNRARDLVAGDYEAGDASWVTGQFNNLNAQIGSYETYDDALFGVKAFYGMSILVRDQEKSDALAAAMTDIQAVENALPYDHHKSVRSNIPVNVYNVIADFGQCRGANTATILPNDAEHTRKYGRTILLRYNIMTHPALFELARQKYQTALAAEFDNDLTLEAGFQRTLWHEVGHYLGVDRTENGRSLGDGLQQYSDVFEEMKADLVSLFAAKTLTEAGHHTEEQLKAIYASGIYRVLQIVKPRPDQPYQTMQLMQWNYYLENGLLAFDNERGELVIRYDRYHEVVSDLLEKILAIQFAGNAQSAGKFVDQYTSWDEQLHGVIAERLQSSTPYRYRYVTFKELPPKE